MTRIAVIGGSGFIGLRMVEVFHLGGHADVRPIVRAPESLAPLSRFVLDARVADARDEDALTAALTGCDVAVYAVAGPPDVITRTAETAYRAADRAGVRRLVYLSSASVHGQSPAPGTTESSPLRPGRSIPYNRAKVEAERMLSRLRTKGRTQVVTLRPGIVFGPRSSWVAGFADAVLDGQAYLVLGARGICNSIYVDNLVHAVLCAAHAEDVDGEAFFVGDDERVTWRDLYDPIARALGTDLSLVPNVAPADSAGFRERVRRLQKSRRLRALATLLGRRRRAPASGLSAERRSPKATLEMTLLHTCTYKLPHEKAGRKIGFEPPVPFDEGCRRSIAWLSFAGYPTDATHIRLPETDKRPL